jgi:hypothetical protein
MAVLNSRAEDLRCRIAQLQRSIKLSEDSSQIQLWTEEIADIKKELRNLNRKAPQVVAVKDASTVGEKMERKLRARGASSSFVRDNSFFI